MQALGTDCACMLYVKGKEQVPKAVIVVEGWLEWWTLSCALYADDRPPGLPTSW